MRSVLDEEGEAAQGLADWLRPPGRTLAVFLGLMLILAGSLGWLGWQWLKQDRALEGQRVQESLEQAADRMAAALAQSLVDLEGYLSFVPGPGAKEPPRGTIVLWMSKREAGAYPPGILLFSPLVPGGKEPPQATFAAGEILEFRRNDPVHHGRLHAAGFDGYGRDGRDSRSRRTFSRVS